MKLMVHRAHTQRALWTVRMRTEPTKKVTNRDSRPPS